MLFTAISFIIAEIFYYRKYYKWHYQKFHWLDYLISILISVLVLPYLLFTVAYIFILVIKRDKKEDEGVDAQTAVNYCLYYMEHFEELIFPALNRPQNAKLFSLLFEEKPSYQELASGIPRLAPIVELNNVLEVSEELFVTPAGFEPAIFWMKARCPWPLDDGAGFIYQNKE